VLWGIFDKLMKGFEGGAGVVALFFIIITGIAVHGTYDKYGVAHICLQSVAIAGLTFVAYNSMFYNKLVKTVLFTGVFIDAVFGIFNHFRIQNYGYEDIKFMSIDREAAFMPNIIENINNKIVKGYTFLSDVNYIRYFAVILTLLAACIVYDIYKDNEEDINYNR
jgi:hypothetical protein